MAEGFKCASTGGQFPATQWTRVLAANGDGEEAVRALNELCAIYWYPLYAFVRRQGKKPEDAQDLTQGFFADLLRHESLERADQEKGRLRSFLLAALKNYMAYEYRKQTAEKRGGGSIPLSIDEELAERRYRSELQDGDSPDNLFERRWAMEVLDRAVGRLRSDYESNGQGQLFTELAPLLAGEERADYPALAQRLAMSGGALRTALSRMRKRYRECLVCEIADTVASPDLIDDELSNLIGVLRAGGSR